MMLTTAINKTGANHEPVIVLPNDEHNQKLVSNVRPPDWVNPDPTGTYNIVVIGAGTAGLVAAVIGAAIGAKVALIEKHLMGGDCLNVGCVPSKAVIRASRVWSELRNAEEYGLRIPDAPKHDFGVAMERMRKLRARISQTDSVHRYKSLGVDVFFGHGRFTAPDIIAVAVTT